MLSVGNQINIKTMIHTPYHIILASNSPRRKELLGGLDLEYEVRVVPGIEENYPDGLTPEQIPQYLACQKAKAYTLSVGEMLITADTLWCWAERFWANLLMKPMPKQCWLN